MSMSVEKISSTPTICLQHVLEVLTNVPFPVMILRGPCHTVIFANHIQCETLRGRNPVGETFAQAYPQMLDHFLPILDSVYRGGESRYEKEVRLHDRAFNISCRPMHDETRKVEGLIVSALDVTAEVAIRESGENQNKWLAFVLDLIPVPTVLVEPGSGNAFLINAAAQREMSGYPKDTNPLNPELYYFTDMNGRRLAKNDWPRFRAARGEELYGLQLVWHSPIGEFPMVIDSRKLPQAYGHPAVVSLHYHDVSELKRAELALQDTIVELQREREIRERFVSTLTHDLRSPLTAAKLTAEVIARENPNSEEIGRLSGRICRSMKRADAMVCDLLDANRMKAGEPIPLRLENHCLNDIVQSCLDGLTILHGDRFVLEAGEPIRGRWCRSSLKRVFENLCGNAVKYGAAGSPITIALIANENDISISVRNVGTPIPREEQAGLFQAYHRTKSAAGGMQPGWGLGLALVRGIAEAHGGKVGLDYSDERGTCFRVTLPRVSLPKNLQLKEV
jgi:signal transduction histidine kinase